MIPKAHYLFCFACKTRPTKKIHELSNTYRLGNIFYSAFISFAGCNITQTIVKRYLNIDKYKYEVDVC